MNKQKNNIKQGKVKKRRRTLGTGWSANILKSLGYSARDVISQMMPNTIEMATQISEVRDELRDTFDTAKSKSKEIGGIAKDEFQKFKDKDLKEAIEDIKSGRIYNKERMDAAINDFGDFGFDDFDNFDEDFDSFDVQSDDPNTNIVVNANIDEDNPMVQAQEVTSATVVTGVEMLSKGNRDNAIVLSTAISKIGVSLTDQFQLLNSEVAKITSTVPRNMSEHLVLTTKFYEQSLDYQKSISENISELKKLYIESRTVVGSDSSETKETKAGKFSYGVNVSDYANLVKTNVKSTVSNNPLISTLTAAVHLINAERNMGGDGKGLAAKATNMLLSSLIPKGTKVAANKLDEFLKGMILPMGMKIGDYQNRWDDPILQTFGNIFGIKAKPDMTADKSKYEKGAVAFDGRVHRAITDIIPTYLRMIASAVTGKEEMAFDYDKGVYKSVNKIRKEFDDKIKESTIKDFFTESLAFGRMVDKIEGITNEQNKELRKTFDDFLSNAVKSGEFVNFRKNGGRDDIAKYTNRDSNDPAVQLIRQFFEGYVDAGRASDLNSIFSTKMMSARDSAEATYKKMTKDALSNNYHLIDNGLYDNKSSNATTSAKGIRSLAMDIYGRDQNSYLRDILSTLATGIKVVNIANLNGDPGSIINHSNRILGQLNLDVQEYNASQAGNSSDNPVIGPISYDRNKANDAIMNVLSITRDPDKLDNLVNKLSNDNKILREDNIIGTILKNLKANKDRNFDVSDRIVNNITGRGIDLIYGRRATDDGNSENGSGNDGDVNNPSGGDTNSDNQQHFPSSISDVTRTIRQFGQDLRSDILNPLNEVYRNDNHFKKIDIFDNGKINSRNKTIDLDSILSDVDSKKENSIKLSSVSLDKKSFLGDNIGGDLSFDKDGIASVKEGYSFNMDIYGRDQNSYLRDILSTLATGIKVVNIANLNENPEYILNHSKRILRQLKLVVKEYDFSKIKSPFNGQNVGTALNVAGDVLGTAGNVLGAASVGVDSMTRVGTLLLDKTLGSEKVSNMTNKFVSTTKDTLVGSKGDDGEYKEGIFSEEANAVANVKNNVTKKVSELVYGTEDGSDPGIVGHIKNFLHGDSKDKTQITSKVKNLGLDFKEHFNARAAEWTGIIFGEDDISAKERLDTFMGDMKGKGSLIGAASVVGALGSFFLPGGPVGGALIGAGMGIVTQSTQLKDFLFGKEEDGERVGGVISKKIQDFFKDNKKGLGIGAIAGVASSIGLLPSLLVPGGPIGGALIGGALSVATKSEMFSNMLYGEGGTKEDPTGGITKLIKSHYSKDKDIKGTFLDAGMGAGVGLIGSFFLPGGPITGALIGAGTNIALNTDKFKNFFFGEKDPEDGKRKGGVFGKYKDMIVEKAEEAHNKLSLWVSENITNPLSASLEPIKERAKRFLFGTDDENGEKGLIGAIADRVNNSAFGELKKAVKENIIDKMKDGFKKIFGGLFHFVGSIAKSPIIAIQAMAEKMDKKNGGDGTSVAKRIAELNAKSREKRKNGKVQEQPTDVSPTENRDSEIVDETAIVANNTTAMKEIAEEQLEETTKSSSILGRVEGFLKEKFGNIRNKRQEKKNHANKNESSELTDNESPTVSNKSSSLIRSNADDSIGKNVEKIAKSIDGQLDGTGYNLNRIYKLLKRRLGKDEDDDDDVGGKGKKFKRFGRRIKELITAPFTFLKDVVVGVGKTIKDGIKTAFKGILNAGKALFKLPGMLFNGAKKLIPAIGKRLLGAFDTISSLIGNGLKSLGNVIEAASTGFGNLVGGALSGLGSLLHGFGIIGKEALGLLAKGGAVAIKGVAKAGSFIAKTAVGAVSGLFKKIRKKKGEDTSNRFIIDGGHLDYVTVVKKIGGGAIESDNNAPNNIIRFPGNNSDSISGVAGDGPSAALSGTSLGQQFSDFKNGIKEGGSNLVSGIKTKGSNAIAKIKGSASNIVEKFKRQDAEEEQRNWREKLLSVVKRSGDDNREHHSIWNSIFSKKGLITMALIALSPLILKAVKGIINFFSGDFGKNILDAIGSLGDKLGRAWDNEGGLTGMVNNTVELGKHFTDAMGLTDRQEYVIDPNTGAIMTDENGNLIKKTVDNSGLTRLKNFIFDNKAKINHETGEVEYSDEYNHTTEVVGKGTEALWKKGMVKPWKKKLRKYARNHKLAVPRTGKGYISVAKARMDNRISKVNDMVDSTKSMMQKVKDSKVVNAVKNSKLGGFISATKDRAVNFVDDAKAKVGGFADNAISGTKNFIGKAKTKAGGIIDNVASGAKNMLGKAKSSKIVGAVADSDMLKNAMTCMRSALDSLCKKFGAVAKKFGKEGAESAIKKSITSLTKNIMNVKVLGKFASKISTVLGKMATSAATLLVSEVVWVGIGAISGAANPGELFDVNMDDIKDLKMKAVMTAIAGVFGALLGTSIGSWIDLISEIVEAVSGFSFTSAAASFALELISDVSGSDMKQQLSDAQKKFDSDYDAYLEEEYNAWVKNQEQSGQATMSFEEFKQSDLATTKSDYKAEINPTLGKRVWDGTKKIASGISKGVKSISKGVSDTFKSHEDVGWFDADGSYYVKNSGSLTTLKPTYRHYNVNGDLIGNVDADEVDKMIESGQLVKSGVTVKSNLATTLDTVKVSVSNAWDTGINKAKETINGWKDRILGKKSSDDDGGGMNLEALKCLMPRKNTIFATPSGSYYSLGDNGYNYYSSNGTLMSSNIPESAIRTMIEQGQLVETERWGCDLLEKVSELGIMKNEKFASLVNGAKTMFNDVTTKISETLSGWSNNIKENGLFWFMKDSETDKTKVAFYDVNGGYYVQNGKGTYNYYNMNGDLINDNVSKEGVDNMLIQGLLTEGEIIEESDAKKAISSIQEKSKELWAKAKEKGEETIDNLLNLLGINKTKTEVSTQGVVDGSTGAAFNNIIASVEMPNTAGKGGDDNHVASKSGIVNGFSYYSQNDPSIKNKSYNLSDGQSDTMGERGCGPTAMSMVASQLTGKHIDPITMANMATEKGYSIEQGTMPNYFGDAASSLGLSSESARPTKENIEAMLKSGKPIILQGQDSREGSPFTNEGHYVVGVKMNGDNLVVNDPRGRQYSKEYNLNSVVDGAQNLWGFSSTGKSKYNDILTGFGGYGKGVDGDMLNGFPYLLQGDDRWGSVQYSSINDSSQTISSSACGPTSMAMVLRSYGHNVTPIDTSNYALANGHRTENSGTAWSFFQPIGSSYGLTTKQFGDANTAIQELEKGYPVIASMGPKTFTSGGHYIVLSGINDKGNILVNDPGKLSRSNTSYDPGIFAREGKQFWSFSDDGEGSINNVSKVANITEVSKLSSGASNANAVINEGTPDAGTMTGNDAEVADTSVAGTAEEGSKSISELLLGGISAFTKPILDWLNGKDPNSAETDENATVSTNSASAISPGSALGNIASNAITAVGNRSVYKSGDDYLGKYTEQFESGGNGPNTISTGKGDAGGVSFGTYQFATWNKSQVASNSKLAQFWNMYYAHKYPGVVPGNNDAFKRAWSQEASSNPTEFKAREASFMASEYYTPQVKKLSDIVDVTTYDRGLQEDVYATAIQFGPNTPVIKNALSGKDVKNMNPKDVINTIQDYKVANNESYFKNCSDKVKASVKNRHDVTERKQMLELANKPPVKPLSDSIKTENNGSPIGGKGGSTNIGQSGTMTKSTNISKAIEHRNSVAMIDNPLFAKMVELLDNIVSNTSGMDNGIKELCKKDFGSGDSYIVKGATHNNIIPVPQSEKVVKNNTEQYYSTAKRISSGVYSG